METYPDILGTEDQEEFRDSIATVDESGKRVWIYPKQPKGRFYNWRSWLSYALLAFLFITPWIKVNGLPLLLFNVLERRFIIFGLHFAPQDFHLFAIGMIIMIVFITLFTVVFGRLFCGWVCPQTIFMEMVFRKIEYWIEGDANAQRRLNKAPWTTNKIVKKVGKQAIFFAIAVLVANTFLAYIIGSDQLLQIIIEPLALHWQGFVAMVLFSFAFYFVFSYMREQVCVAICPYGRLQSVLLDENSIVIHYDHVRGEPRGKLRKKQSAATATLDAAADAKPLGDCIDCHLCVQVCPTGIDIRNGTQLECVNCTACIDACDEVMDKIDRPRGLIRYDSLVGVEEGRKKIFTTRVIAYSIVLLALLVLEVVLFAGRTQVETLLLRTPGMLYQEVDEQTLSNLYNYQIINKTDEALPIEFRLVGDIEGSIRWIGEPPVAAPTTTTEGAVFVDIAKSELEDRKTRIVVEVISNGEVIGTAKTNFLGPMK
jgi:cytochrome c oxidase accessory protein FixG